MFFFDPVNKLRRRLLSLAAPLLVTASDVQVQVSTQEQFDDTLMLCEYQAAKEFIADSVDVFVRISSSLHVKYYFVLIPLAAVVTVGMLIILPTIAHAANDRPCELPKEFRCDLSLCGAIAEQAEMVICSPRVESSGIRAVLNFCVSVYFIGALLLLWRLVVAIKHFLQLGKDVGKHLSAGKEAVFVNVCCQGYWWTRSADKTWSADKTRWNTLLLLSMLYLQIGMTGRKCCVAVARRYLLALTQTHELSHRALQQPSVHHSMVHASFSLRPLSPSDLRH
eukprot:m.87300 g.87300  ORF g.87300 m.87300 type:complete len:280 (-) comp14904_c1_seq1:372-1211(-)